MSNRIEALPSQLPLRKGWPIYLSQLRTLGVIALIHCSVLFVCLIVLEGLKPATPAGLVVLVYGVASVLPTLPLLFTNIHLGVKVIAMAIGGTVVAASVYTVAPQDITPERYAVIVPASVNEITGTLTVQVDGTPLPKRLFQVGPSIVQRIEISLPSSKGDKYTFKFIAFVTVEDRGVRIRAESRNKVVSLTDLQRFIEVGLYEMKAEGTRYILTGNRIMTVGFAVFENK